MATWLKVWDASENLTFDATTRISRVLGSATIAAGATGSITDAGFSTGTAYWASIRNTLSPGVFDNIEPPTISVSGTTLSYDNSGARLEHLVIYGVY